MTDLLLTPRHETGLAVHDVTPKSADWGYVGFAVYDLAAGETVSEVASDNEHCLVIMAGRADIESADEHWENVGGRASVFDDEKPGAVYLPMNQGWKVTAHNQVELAVCRAPGTDGKHPARLIRADDMSLEKRGEGTNARYVCNILPDVAAADRLLVVEVRTPGGHWSSYPPHKHDTDDLPQESRLEETYYHRVNPSQGYVMQRVYTDDRSLDESMAVPDRAVVLVPRGYHPVGAPHGYDSYYLNVMAGPKRVWKFRDDPAHGWITKKKTGAL